MSISKSAQILFAGVLLAMFVYGLGQFFVYKAQSRLHELRIECEKPDKYSELAKKFGGDVLCDPVELMRMQDSTQSASGITAQLVLAQKDLWAAQRWPLPAASVLLGLSALPWFWYFFLRRVREFCGAIAGK